VQADDIGSVSSTERLNPWGKRFRRFAGGCLVLTGVGHLLTELVAPSSSERAQIEDALRQLRVSLPGAERTVWELFFGFSLVMGVLLVGLGVTLFSLRPSLASSIAATLTTTLVAALAWKYLFLVPGALTTLAAIGSAFALATEPTNADAQRGR
jgi:hypothetical protein